MIITVKNAEDFLETIKNTKTNERLTHTQVFKESYTEENYRDQALIDLANLIIAQQSFGILNEYQYGNQTITVLPANTRYYCNQYEEKEEVYYRIIDGRRCEFKNYVIIIELGITLEKPKE